MENTKVNHKGYVLDKILSSSQGNIAVVFEKFKNVRTGYKHVTCSLATSRQLPLPEVYLEKDDVKGEVYFDKNDLGTKVIDNVSELDEIIRDDFYPFHEVELHVLLANAKSPRGLITTIDIKRSFIDLEVFKINSVSKEEVQDYLTKYNPTRDDFYREAITEAHQTAINYGLNEQDYLELCFLYKTLYQLILNY